MFVTMLINVCYYNNTSKIILVNTTSILRQDPENELEQIDVTRKIPSNIGCGSCFIVLQHEPLSSINWKHCVLVLNLPQLFVHCVALHTTIQRCQALKADTCRIYVWSDIKPSNYIAKLCHGGPSCLRLRVDHNCTYPSPQGFMQAQEELSAYKHIFTFRKCMNEFLGLSIVLNNMTIVFWQSLLYASLTKTCKKYGIRMWSVPLWYKSLNHFSPENIVHQPWVEFNDHLYLTLTKIDHSKSTFPNHSPTWQVRYLIKFICNFLQVIEWNMLENSW